MGREEEDGDGDCMVPGITKWLVESYTHPKWMGESADEGTRSQKCDQWRGVGCRAYKI
jgi:hypothetical protein